MKLLLLWHMHQPAYKDYASGHYHLYHLPWVYLHTTKDYYEMPHLVESFDRVKVTFNLVPCLIEAINEYARGEATDDWLRLFRKSPELMSKEEKRFVIDNFFLVDAERILEPHPRYKELYLKRARQQEFSPADLRDLQMLFHLAWLGESMKRQHPAIKRLVEKGSGFSEEDKQTLLETMTWVLKATLSLYQSLWEAGKVELSTTPYYHPILPLLCDTQTARQSTPKVKLPELNFFYPEDARIQTAMAVECFERTFGRRPEGFWPAEGGVSSEAVAILSEYGGQWAATDEEILRRSRILSPGKGRQRDSSLVAYQPYLYRVGERDIALFFRDHTLSDLFGFVYQRWNEAEAVEDVMGRLRAIQKATPNAVVSVILDGENAWEHYAANGYDFLTLFYERLEQTDWIETTTFSACLQNAYRYGRLDSLHPGSWIGANFSTWIGDDDKNRAWDYLKRAREAVRRHALAADSARANGRQAGHPSSLMENVPELTRKSLLAAEGSDWFWWFGPTHSSLQDPVFDLIFRTHLKNVYVGLDQPWPAYLDTPVGTYRGALQRQPVAFMSPAIDGEDSNYFEWLSAGLLSLQSQGAMHRTASRFSQFHFGFDRENIYLRVDFDRPAKEALALCRLKIELYSAHQDLSIEVNPGEVRPDAACDDIVEVKIPFQALEVTFGQPFDVILIIANKHEIERFPQSGSVTLVVPREDLEVENWMV
ncbi:MAG: glycoside hydrolase [Acidobacteria bacterium]|nr:glycoside hydrolase [Acidobacteriota bacterium]